MSPRLKKTIILLLAAVLCVSVAVLIRQFFQYQEGEAEYAEAEALVKLPDLTELDPAPLPEPETGTETEPETEPKAETESPVYVDPYAVALAAMDFTALREVNPDVLGWILIPGTAVSYPLLQGEDNDYYLGHTWKRWTNAVGSIFLDYRSDPSLTDFNTIIYGHRMNNGSMFGSLKYFSSRSYWAAHPAVYITDDDGARRYDIFAAYEVSTAGETYRLSFSSEQKKQDYIDYCLAQSVIDTGLTPTVYDRIVTLSTCTGRGHATRWVVQALLRGEAPEPAEEPSEQAGGIPEEEAVPEGAETSTEQAEGIPEDQTDAQDQSREQPTDGQTAEQTADDGN